MRGIGLVLVVVCSTLASAQPVVLPTPAQITQVSFTGDGCVSETDNTVDLSADQRTLRVRISDSHAVIGAKHPIPDSRRSCTISLVIAPPPGFTYRLTAIHSAGTAKLAQGIRANHSVNASFQGRPAAADATHAFVGPLEGTWQRSQTLADFPWAPCEAQRNLDLQLKVDVRRPPLAPESWLALHDPRGSSLEQRFALEWAACP